MQRKEVPAQMWPQPRSPNQLGMPCWRSRQVSAPVGRREARARSIRTGGAWWRGGACAGARWVPPPPLWGRSPPAACRHLSCPVAKHRSQSPLLHGCNALGTPLYLYKNGIAPHLDFAVTVQTVVMSQRTQLSNHSQAIQACSSVQAEAVSRVSDVLG